MVIFQRWVNVALAIWEIMQAVFGKKPPARKKPLTVFMLNA
jgi:hypothetical protein